MSSRIGRISLLVAVVTVASFIGMAPADAAPLPVTVTPSSAAPGEDFTVSGPADCLQGSTMQITVADLSLTQTATTDTPFSVVFTVPTDAALGAHTVEIIGSECQFATATITVIASTATTAAPTTTVAPTTTAPAVKPTAVAADPAFTG